MATRRLTLLFGLFVSSLVPVLQGKGAADSASATAFYGEWFGSIFR